MKMATAFPQPHSPEEVNLLVGIVRSIPQFPQMIIAEQENLLKQLESYECYTQVASLLEWRINYAVTSESYRFADFIKLMRIQYLGLENFTKFAETAVKCVENLKLSFALTRIHIAE